MTYGPQDRTLTKACRQWALLNVQLIADLPPNLLREVHLSVCNHINDINDILTLRKYRRIDFYLREVGGEVVAEWGERGGTHRSTGRKPPAASPKIGITYVVY